MKRTVLFTSRFPVGHAGGIEATVGELVPRIAALRAHYDVRDVFAFSKRTAVNQLPLLGDLVAAVVLAWRSRQADVVVVNGAEYAWPRMLDPRKRRRTICVWHGTRAGEVPALVPRVTFAIAIYLAMEVWLQRLALAAERQIVVSVTTLAELRATYGRSVVARVVPNGAPLDSVAAPATGREAGRVAWVGTNRYKKGFDIAYEACELVRTRAPHLRLIAIGIDRPRDLDASWLECTGVVAHAEARRTLATCDVLIGSTRYEGCSVAIIEALAAGIPVLAGPPIAWMVDDDAAVVARLDAASFAAKLATLVNDPAMLDRMSTHARERAGAFDWDAAARAYAEEVDACV